ncbi:MAG: LysR family transcriptional regulator [Paracoccaceae bacterium]
MRRQNWDDLRFVFAVSETGSVSGAARMLGVNHATVLRRIAAFEEAAGTVLFDKTPRGYAVPADRARLIAAVREVDAAVQSFGRLAAGVREPLHGRVRVTSTDTLCAVILPGVAARLGRVAPELRIDILCSNSHADLGRIEAEIAVRPAPELADHLVGERAAELGFAAYVRAGTRPDRWLGLSGVLAGTGPGRWLEGSPGLARASASADSFLVLAGMAAEGEGIAALPCIAGDADLRLERLAEAMPRMSVPIWVASHADLADVPRIAKVRTLLAAELAREAARLAGRG